METETEMMEPSLAEIVTTSGFVYRLSLWKELGWALGQKLWHEFILIPEPVFFPELVLFPEFLLILVFRQIFST